MNKSMNVSKEVSEQSTRRDFFKKTAAYSVSALAAASVIAPVKVKAEDDPAIMEEQPWATTWGTPVTANLYGQPSPYESNVTRRTTELLSSGNMKASIAVTPIQDLSGIIVPNGLFFNRHHGGTPEIPALTTAPPITVDTSMESSSSGCKTTWLQRRVISTA